MGPAGSEEDVEVGKMHLSRESSESAWSHKVLTHTSSSERSPKHKSSCCAYKVRIRHQLINKCNRRNKFCRSNIKTIALMIIMGTTTTTTTMVMATTTATTTWSKWLPQVCSSPDLGRYLVATRDLKPGELVISETPLIIGPQVRHFKHSHHYNFVFQCLS